MILKLLKYCIEKWDKNKDLLKQNIQNLGNEMHECSYKDIVKLTVDSILNDDDGEKYGFWSDWDTDKIVEIDHGDYQGTLLYVIPLDSYQPSEDQYLMTSVGYGSCSGCDTLQSIQYSSISYDDDNESETLRLNETQIADYMTLSLHIIQKMIMPYSDGLETA